MTRRKSEPAPYYLVGEDGKIPFTDAYGKWFLKQATMIAADADPDGAARALTARAALRDNGTAGGEVSGQKRRERIQERNEAICDLFDGYRSQHKDPKLYSNTRICKRIIDEHNEGIERDFGKKVSFSTVWRVTEEFRK